MYLSTFEIPLFQIIRASVSLSEEVENVVNKVSKSVVRVRSRRGNGSGVVWNSDGLILTCNHIVRKLDDYEASLNNGRLFQPRL